MSHNLHPELNAIWKALWRLQDIDLELSDGDWDDLCEAMVRLNDSLSIPHEKV
jgi:hypothetical protein